MESDGPGTGSEFTARLPVVPSLAQKNGGDEEVTHPSSRRRILVVDDNRDAAMSLAMMLKLMGNEAWTAHDDGLEALDVAAACRTDLILLDIGMPRLNGHETARRVREQPWGKDVVLVALTGWGQDDDRRKSEEAGFDPHMVKPVGPAELDKLLANLSIQIA